MGRPFGDPHLAKLPIPGFQEDAWPRNLHVLEEIRSHLLQPTLITMNSLLSACEKASEWQLALQLLTLARHGYRID